MSVTRLVEKELRFYSHNVQGINDPYKLDSLLELLDQHQIDIAFLQETFQGPEKNQEDSNIFKSTRGGYAVFEYKNKNSRRGIQFRISKDLEGIIMEDYCRKNEFLEVISIRVGAIILVGAYVPNGYTTEGVEELLELIEEIEAEGEDFLLLGDWNTKATALGNASVNAAGKTLDNWLLTQDYTIYKPLETTFNSRNLSSSIDVAMWKGPRTLDTAGSLLHSVKSDHKGLFILMRWKETEKQIQRQSYNVKKLAKLLHQRKGQGGQWTALEVDEVFSTYLQGKKAAHIKRRTTKYHFKKSQELKKLERIAYKAHRSGDPTFPILRAAAHLKWRQEKRQSFKRDLDDIILSKNVKHFCRFLRQTSPKETWAVNTGQGREQEIASQLIRVQEERPEIEDFILEESSNLLSLEFPMKELINPEDVHDAIKHMKKNKAPGPSGFSYDHLKALDEETIDILVEALNNSLNGGSLPTNWFKLLIRPLSKKPGALETRPISLMESLLKLLDKSFNQHLLSVSEEHELISSKQFGFTRGRSATDQLVRMIDAIKSRKRKAILLSVDLKGAYDRVSNVQLYERLKGLIEPGWRQYLFTLLFKREFRVISRNSTHEQWKRLHEGIPQGLPSGPTLFNIFIDPCLRKIDAIVDDSFPFADDNSVLFIQRDRENLKTFLGRVSNRIIAIKQIYGEVKATLSPEKSALLAFGFRPKEASLEGIYFKPCHRILGIKISQGLYFNLHVQEVAQKLRKYLKWVKRFKSDLTERQKKACYTMFIQSQMDYHLIPIWHLLSQEKKQMLTRIATQGARIILGAPTTIDGDISCREARILPPEHRIELMYLRRHEKLSCLPNKSFPSYLNRLELLNIQGKTQEELLHTSSEILWGRYHSKYPFRAMRLQREPPKKLTYLSRLSFLLRTAQVKTKDWRVRHGQLYPDQQPQDRLCRYCSQYVETIDHLLEECLHRTPRRARVPLLALHQSMEANQPTIWSASWVLTRRSEDKETHLLEDALRLWVQAVLPNRSAQDAESI